MGRARNTKSDGGSFDKETIEPVWKKGSIEHPLPIPSLITSGTGFACGSADQVWGRLLPSASTCVKGIYQLQDLCTEDFLVSP
jgi:hypothetical protein